MARSRTPMPSRAVNGRRRFHEARARKGLLIISFEEAAELLEMRPRTLRGLLKRSDAACLVPIPHSNRYRLDRKGFFRWCRQIGFESARQLGGG